MQPELRARFNADFTPEKYAALLRCVNETEKWPADFRISETPIFLTREFHDELVAAAKEIVGKTRTPEFARHAATAIPPGLEVPNETTHPAFLVVDFGVCTVENQLVPRLIELQAFPSLYGFQFLLLGCMRQAFAAIPRVLQCVAPLGVVSSVLTITASTCASEIVRGPPTRGSSYSPSRRVAMNRIRHFPTV